MTSQGSDAFTYDLATLRLSSRGTETFAYDDNGSVTSDSQAAYTYMLRNQMKTATVAGHVATYSYDSDEWRFMKVTPTATTLYFRGPGGQLLTEIAFLSNGARTSRDYIYAGSRLPAVVDQ